MALYDVKVNSHLGADTRVQVVKVGNPKKETYLDRNSKYETSEFGRGEGSLGERGKPATTPRVRSGRLSANAKKILQRIGGCVAATSVSNQSAFLTGTFPGDSHREQSAIAAQSGWLVHRLKAWIYKRIGANVGYYVWEFQKRGTLHLHYVVLVPDPVSRAAIISDFREEWIRLIAGASKRCGVDLFIGKGERNFFLEKEKLQIYAQECFKSCASYLSKYLAKGRSSDFPAPARMWGATREARHLVASSVISLAFHNLTLSNAENVAYQLQAESDTPREKEFFFRHRFSQGFTILLYNDTFRMNLSEMQRQAVNKRKIGYLDKIASMWRTCIDKGMTADIVRDLSKPGLSDLQSLINYGKEGFKVASPQEVVECLLELRAVISEVPSGGFRMRFEVRERIAVIIAEVMEAHDLSLLRESVSGDNTSNESSLDVAGLECPQDTRQQLRLPGTGEARKSIRKGKR